jgi:predicted CXXCH cytochrome family protein
VKRIAFVLLAACVIVLAATGVAYANFGPHGGYLNDSDSCAGCHRAHTSFSTLGWTDLQGAQRASALLVSDATNMTDFCYACHGDGAPGASTNVQMGIFDSGPTAGAVGTVNPANPAATTFAVSNSSYDATLNGGGFQELGGHSASPVMSAHDMNRATPVQGPLVRWGYVNPGTGLSDVAAMSSFTCATCHDPHGSSNYRLLKDSVNGITVGGYDGSNIPSPTVLSNEQGYPTGGFRKGADGQVDIADYKPNYTSSQIRWKSNNENISAWCAACHTAYAQDTSAYNYGAFESWVTSSGSLPAGEVGLKTRHRHLINVPISIGTDPNPANRALTVALVNDDGLPLDMQLGVSSASATSTKYWDNNGYIGCLTCHRAHGSEATMQGWAVAKLATTPVGAAPIKVTPGNTSLLASFDNPLGVAPNYSQAILRYNDRGVCERCHNK